MHCSCKLSWIVVSSCLSLLFLNERNNISAAIEEFISYENVLKECSRWKDDCHDFLSHDIESDDISYMLEVFIVIILYVLINFRVTVPFKLTLVARMHC